MPNHDTTMTPGLCLPPAHNAPAMYAVVFTRYLVGLIRLSVRLGEEGDAWTVASTPWLEASLFVDIQRQKLRKLLVSMHDLYPRWVAPLDTDLGYQRIDFFSPLILFGFAPFSFSSSLWPITLWRQQLMTEIVPSVLSLDARLAMPRAHGNLQRISLLTKLTIGSVKKKVCQGNTLLYQHICTKIGQESTHIR